LSVERSGQAGRAVFLSYASQDAEAVKRIAESLRAAGIEVWFDQNELVGGDAWDAKIRKQIKECALFVPIVSANTQARTEGYFRLEWRLADQRTHLMAKSRAFLLPVVIDATRESEAQVPDSFLEVQWTHLRQGFGGARPPGQTSAFGGARTPGQARGDTEAGADAEALKVFCERVKRLVQGGEVVHSEPAPEVGGSDVARVSGPVKNVMPSSPVSTGRETRATSRRRWLIFLGAAVGLVVASMVTLRKESAVPTLTATSPAKAEAPLSEARQLVAKARTLALHDQWDEVTREDFALAEQLLKRAVEIDPTDGEAWAAAALVSAGQISSNYDNSQTRREALRLQAERAIKLAPDSIWARFARAYSYRYQQAATSGEALRLHRELVAREPGSKWFWRQLGRVLEVAVGQANLEEAFQCFDRAIARPGGDAIALRMKADTLSSLRRYREVDPLYDAALALRPTAGHLYAAKISFLIAVRPDLKDARELAARIPPAYLLDDLGAYSAAIVALYSRQPEECLRVLVGLPHDFLDCRYYKGPKTYLTGMAHRQAGRDAAARSEWRIALDHVERRLATEPGAPEWLRWRVELLALLGEKPAAEEALRVYEQLTRAGPLGNGTWPIYVALGRNDAVCDFFEQRLQRNEAREATALVRFDSRLDPLREFPRFTALRQRADAIAAQPLF
jgi:tetratricopeptide (TPR) repeat protein